MPRLLPFLLLACLLGGCATSSTRVEGGVRLAGMQRFFVLANSNDNRALDRQVVNALRARGLAAESGPRTMMPEDTQVVVAYEDHWSWDFGERLQVLRLTVRDPRTGGTLAVGEFTAKIPGRQSPAEIVGALVAKLFDQPGG